MPLLSSPGITYSPFTYGMTRRCTTALVVAAVLRAAVRPR
jgi:hypothetical protein